VGPIDADLSASGLSRSLLLRTAATALHTTLAAELVRLDPPP
jgi:hypothetical protein